MKKLIIITIFILLASISLVFAENVDLISPTEILTVYIGQKNTADISLKNTGNFVDSFFLSAYPSQWISFDRYGFTLAPGENTTIALTIEPPRAAEKGLFEIVITARSVSTGESDSTTILLDLRREFDLFISKSSVNTQLLNLGDNLIVDTVVTNLNKQTPRNVIITTSILKDNLLIEKFDDEITVDPDSSQTVSNSIEIKNTLVFGNYKIKIELKDKLNRVLDEKELFFAIKKAEDFSKERSTQFGLFYLTTTVKVINIGNTPDSTYSLSESLPSYFSNFFFPDIEPKSEEVKGNRIVYTWELAGIDPGQSVTLVYQIRFTSVVVAILAIAFGLYLFNYFYYKPHVAKKHSPLISEPKEEAIHLHVRNRSRHEIKNIIVKDRVPQLARVIKKFETMEPKVQLTTKGTLLTWKIDKLAPGEERVLSYRIVPVMEVPGGIKLPKAYFSYEGKKHHIDRIAEKIVERIR